MEVLVPALLTALVTGAVLATAAAWRAHRERVLLLRKLQKLAVPAAAPSTGLPLVRQTHHRLGVWWRLLQRAGLLEDPGGLLEQAGLEWSPARLTALTLGFGLGGSLAGYALLGTAAGALVGLAVGLCLPSLRVRARRARRLRKLEEQLPEAIDLLGRAIRAGHALPTGLRLVAEESPEPLSGEFRRSFEEQRYGLPFEDSLHALARRVPLVDVRVMVVAILVQREVGGNLAEILDKLSHLIRTRFALRRQARVHSAQGRLSGYVLAGMPLALAGAIFIVSPSYLSVLLDDPLGKVMLGGALVLQLVGYTWIWRILKLDL